MLALGIAAQAAACVFLYGVPYLVPVLRDEHGLSLAQSGVLVACPTVGLVLTLYLWGAATDRFGERGVLTLGLSLSALFLLLASFADSTLTVGALFILAGAAGGSVSAASGRVVLGWFAPEQRGLAMGLRQTSTPLGMGIAALAVPPISHQWGVAGASLFAAALAGVVAVAVALLVVDPPRPPAPELGKKPPSPYKTPVLWRLHGSSALLVWTQFATGAFGLVFLIDVCGWDAVSAGWLMGGAQVLGALLRIATGKWSDAVGSRLRPMRQLAVMNTFSVLLLAACAVWPTWFSPIALLLACAITAGGNALAFTSSAELAGPYWAGRALGLHNTGQNITASAAPPLLGALVGATSYGFAFAFSACFAAVAVFVTPASAN
jgi:sugar phosphate permease